LQKQKPEELFSINMEKHFDKEIENKEN
jgi:hypothetical protein